MAQTTGNQLATEYLNKCSNEYNQALNDLTAIRTLIKELNEQRKATPTQEIARAITEAKAKVGAYFNIEVRARETLERAQYSYSLQINA